MTTVAKSRYRVVDGSPREGHDTLLDRPVTAARLASSSPRRLARQLRSLAVAPWTEVLDAVPRDDHVVLVLPASHQTLADRLAAGMPAPEAVALAETLRPALLALGALGLRPASLDPADLGTTATGTVLMLPTDTGPDPDDAEIDGLLARLGHGSGPAPRSGDTGRPAVPVAGATKDQPTVVIALPSTSRLPRPGISAAESGSRQLGSWRTVLVAAAAVLGVLTAGLVAEGIASDTTGAGGGPQAPAAPPPSVSVGDQAPAAAPPAPAPDQAPDQAPDPTPLESLLADLSDSPADAGPQGAALREALESMRDATGPEQAAAGAGVIELVRTAGGGIDADVAERATEVATPLAQPADLPALVAMTTVDPESFGPRTPLFLGRLVTLLDELSGEPARTEAADLLDIVRAGPDQGEFTPTFTMLAAPVLSGLAQPADLAASSRRHRSSRRASGRARPCSSAGSRCC